jgi:hypothetical protein
MVILRSLIDRQISRPSIFASALTVPDHESAYGADIEETRCHTLQHSGWKLASALLLLPVLLWRCLCHVRALRI